MHLLLFDTADRNNLFPITLTRAVADIRMGMLTIKERWERVMGLKAFVMTEKYLQPLYEKAEPGEYLLIDARLIPSADLIKKLRSLTLNTSLHDDTGLVAGKVKLTSVPDLHELFSLFTASYPVEFTKRITLPQHIFQASHEMIVFDFNLLTRGRTSAAFDETVRLINPSDIFIEEGAVVSYSILNAATGPVFIGKGATVMEGCLLRGPLALCEGAVLKMGTKIYGATVIGPYSTGGGEIKNSILTAYSNKGHDGYLGDSVIGEWCNFGAGSSASNVKNTASEIGLWNYSSKSFVNAGNKCGVIMGDYSRTAINTSVNTGTVAGVCCNIFGQGLTPKFIPDFSWGIDGKQPYEFDKALKDIANWKNMKNKMISETERQILKHIFEMNNK